MSAGLTRRYVLLRMLRWLPLGIVLPFIVLLPQARGLSLTTIGAIWALHSVVTLLLEVPSGALADGYGRRRVLLAGAVLMVVALVLYAVAVAAVAFAAAVTALAAGRALTSGALDAWYVDTLRGRDPGADLRPGLSRGSASDASGLALGALVGGFLPLASGGLPDAGGGAIVYTPATLVGAGAAVAYLAALVLLVHEPPLQTGGVPMRERFGAIARSVRLTLRGSVVVRSLLVTSASFGIALTAIELLWQPRLAGLLGDAHEHTVLFGVLVAGSMSLMAVGATMSPRLSGPLGARRGYLVAVVGSALSILVMAAASGPSALVVGFLLFYLLMGVGDPVHFELLHEATADGVRATVLSTESLAAQLGGGAGNLLLGALAGATSIALAWYLVASLLALSGLVVLRLPARLS